MNLARPEGVDRLEREIQGKRPRVVILDSVQQVFGNMEEGDAGPAGAVYGELFRLRDRYEVTFLLIHHPRKRPSDRTLDALEMVRGTTAHGTQASTVWFAQLTAQSVMNLVQPKRRGAEKQSLRIRYSTQGEDGPITLAAEGTVEEAETVADRASEAIVEFMADRAEARTAEIVRAAAGKGIASATAKRALDHLVRVKSVFRVSRGLYRLARGDAFEPAGNGQIEFDPEAGVDFAG